MAAPPPPGSQGLPFLGQALAFLADPFAFQAEKTRKHGLVWKTRILGRTTVFFSGPRGVSFFLDPDNFTRENGSPPHLRELLHPDAVPFIDGDRHRTRKRLLLAAFTPEAMATYVPNLEQLVQRYLTRWETGEQRLNGELTQLAFDMANVLFAAADPTASDATVAADFDALIRGAFAAPIKLPFTTYGKALKARDRLRGYIKEAVASRGGAGTALAVLKGARSAAGEALTSTELELELLHFFFAAHGGLTAVLAWLTVILGQRPEVAARIRAEVDALPAGALTFAGLDGMRYTAAVGRELRRVYPLAPSTFFGVARRELEYDGYRIEQGWVACASIWSTLHDGSTFQEPATFKAERLTDAAMASLPDNAFVPQGGGPPEGHRCPGQALTELVMPLFAAALLRGHTVELPAQDLSPGAGGLGPLPRDGLRAIIKPLS
jgi:cytochrome P450